MNRTDTQLRINELVEKLENGMSISEIYAVYMPKWNVAYSTIGYYLSSAKNIISDRLSCDEAIIREGRAEKIEKEFEKLVSTIELDAALCEFVQLGMGTIIEEIRNDKTEGRKKFLLRDVLYAIKVVAKMREGKRPAGKKTSSDEINELGKQSDNFKAEDDVTQKFMDKIKEQVNTRE